MKTFRWKDVPKGERLSYFFTYYRWQLFYGVFGLLCAAVLISPMLRPRTDVSILWLTSDFNMMTDTVLREEFGNMPWDVNGDGKTSVALQFIEFPDDYASALETQMETLTLISSGRFPVYLLNETAKGWFEETGMIGTWADYGATEASAYRDRSGTEEPFAIPCSELKFFDGTGISANSETYLVIGAAPADEEKLADYRAQIRVLESLLMQEEPSGDGASASLEGSE